MNREQSAFTFGDDASVGVQDAALSNYTNAAVIELNAFRTGAANVASQLAGMSCDVTITQDDLTAFIEDVRNRGVDALPQMERDVLTLFGVDPASVLSWAKRFR